MADTITARDANHRFAGFSVKWKPGRNTWSPAMVSRLRGSCRNVWRTGVGG